MSTVETFGFVCDTPVLLADQADHSRVQVAMLGDDWQDPRYGKFGISAGDVANWQRLLSDHFQGRVPIDVDHATDINGRSEAAGWITALDLEGDRVMATVEWTPLGKQLVGEKRYLYFSPTFTSDLEDMQGNSLGPALLRVALTNNPFLHKMPAVTLSTSLLDGLSRLHAPAERIPDKADSRPAMTDFAKIAKALGLPEDADETKILASVTELQDATKPEPGKDDKPVMLDAKSLEAAAKANGKILLTADEVVQLQQDASEGKAANATLKELRFESAFTKALEAGKVDAKPETKEMHKGIYELDADKSIALLEGLPKIVNLSQRGGSGDAGEVNAPEGGDTDRFELHAKAEAYMAEHKENDYMKALAAVQEA